MVGLLLVALMAVAGSGIVAFLYYKVLNYSLNMKITSQRRMKQIHSSKILWHPNDASDYENCLLMANVYNDMKIQRT